MKLLKQHVVKINRKRMAKEYIVGFVLVITFLSCSKSNKPEKTAETFPVQDIVIMGEVEGWGADIKLSITEISRNDSSVSYTVTSLDKGKNVGFKVSVPNDDARELTISSTGINSDNFIQTISRLYKEEPDTSLHFVTSKKMGFIDLNQFAKEQFGQQIESSNGSQDLKLFIESENPDDYAEFYLNINEAEHWIEFKEKEDSYRKQVIKGLRTK
jgi:hypothetical protein